MISRPRPSLKGVSLRSPNGIQNVAWCPWCEALHVHGGANGHRVAHCRVGAGSPFTVTGYDLDIDHVADTADDRVAAMVRAAPNAPMVRGATLYGKVRAASSRLRAMVVASFLGRRIASESVIARLPGTTRRVDAWPAWNGGWVLSDASIGIDLETGSHLLSLGSVLHGLPQGVVAVRVLEGATGARFDAEAVFAIQAAVDAWALRGSPDGSGRR